MKSKQSGSRPSSASSAGSRIASACALSVTVVLCALPDTAHANEGRRLSEIKEADKATPLASWTPIQQWLSTRRSVERHGYGSNAGMLVFADELGPNLSELGRVAVIDNCFEYVKSSAEDALMWALCGPDVKAFDAKKLETQLKAEGIAPEDARDILRDVNDLLARAKKTGAAVEEAAKDDPGVAALLKVYESATAEWNAYLGKNKDAHARYLALKDAVRSGKSNHKGFGGCWEATRPAFVKLVKGTKFPWELSGDYLPGYMSVVITSPESWITAASHAMCAYSVHEGGEALAAAALVQPGGVYRVGPRSLALAKVLDPAFKVKFSERSLSLDNMRSSWRRAQIKVTSINDIKAIMTPRQGTIAGVKHDKETDATKISFKGDTVDACLNWKTTNRIQSRAVNGDPIYERVCTKRGKVANQEEATEVPTRFADGLAAGVDVMIVGGFPVTAWKAGKFVAVLGVPGAQRK
jgi:hypothetical protein